MIMAPRKPRARTKLSREASREYLEVMQGRYAAAGHRGRTALLDEMERVTGLGRKTLTRLMSSEELRRRPWKGSIGPGAEGANGAGEAT